jgi:hypothetical protein
MVARTRHPQYPRAVAFLERYARLSGRDPVAAENALHRLRCVVIPEEHVDRLDDAVQRLRELRTRESILGLESKMRDYLATIEEVAGLEGGRTPGEG